MAKLEGDRWISCLIWLAKLQGDGWLSCREMGG